MNKKDLYIEVMNNFIDEIKTFVPGIDARVTIIIRDVNKVDAAISTDEDDMQDVIKAINTTYVPTNKLLDIEDEK